MRKEGYTVLVRTKIFTTISSSGNTQVETTLAHSGLSIHADMTYRSFFLFCVSIAVIGLAHGSWWEDEINRGRNPWKRSNSENPPKRQQDKSAEDICKCVLDYQCDNKTGVIITDGMGIIGWR